MLCILLWEVLPRQWKVSQNKYHWHITQRSKNCKILHQFGKNTCTDIKYVFNDVYCIIVWSRTIVNYLNFYQESDRHIKNTIWDSIHRNAKVLYDVVFVRGQ